MNTLEQQFREWATSNEVQQKLENAGKIIHQMIKAYNEQTNAAEQMARDLSSKQEVHKKPLLSDMASCLTGCGKGSDQ